LASYLTHVKRLISWAALKIIHEDDDTSLAMVAPAPLRLSHDPP
jgi:hypothetical protein